MSFHRHRQDADPDRGVRNRAERVRRGVSLVAVTGALDHPANVILMSEMINKRSPLAGRF